MPGPKPCIISGYANRWRATLAEANEQRDRRLWEDLAKGLISQARILYAGEDLGLDLENRSL
jgi:hypothetical protein